MYLAGETQESRMQETVNYYRFCIDQVKYMQEHYDEVRAQIMDEVEKVKADIREVQALADSKDLYIRADEQQCIQSRLHKKFNMWGIERFIVPSYGSDQKPNPREILRDNLNCMSQLAYATVSKQKVKINVTSNKYELDRFMPEPVKVFQNGYAEYPKSDLLMELIAAATEANYMYNPHLLKDKD